MKIIVHNQENNISLRLPGWLVYGRFSIRIAIAAIRKHAPNCGIPPEMLGQLLTSLRDFARTHPGWWWISLPTRAISSKSPSDPSRKKHSGTTVP